MDYTGEVVAIFSLLLLGFFLYICKVDSDDYNDRESKEDRGGE